MAYRQWCFQTHDGIQRIISEHESPHKVKLGDDYQYPIKGSGESSYKLDSVKSMKMKDVLFVPRLKKNLLSISALDAKGMKGCIYRWPSPYVPKRKYYR